MTEIRINCGR